MLRINAVWLWNSTTFSDKTDNIRQQTDFNFLSASTNVLYFGMDNRWTGLLVDLTTNGSYTSLVYEYKGTDGWTKLSLIDSYAWDQSKYVRWVLPTDWIKFNFTATDPYSATPPDTKERYWIRISCSAVTTTAVIDKIRAMGFTTYTTPLKVARFLQTKRDFAADTKPTDLDIENLIRRREDYIDYMTKKSWRANCVTEETDPKLVDYNRFGIFLRHRNFYKVYSVGLWNGSSFDTMTSGRANDYFINYDLGMIYITRLFMLPANYGVSGRYWAYSMGEWKNAIQVDYVYGRDLETDPEFYIVEDIATKLAAVDVMRHSDYSTFVASGMDKVPLDSKIRLLEEECKEKVGEISGISIY